MGDFSNYSNGVSDHIVRVRGLPWSTKEADIRQFFDDCSDIRAVHFTFTREGRPTGEAYIELGSNKDVDTALLKHREHMQNRYIEVFSAKRGEMDFVLRRSSKRAVVDDTKDNVVRLRGLPFGCTNDDVINFFDGLEIAPEGIVRPMDKTGRVTGEAFVKFLDKDTTDRALDRHMQAIGHRYIEVFRSTDEELYLAKYPNGGGPEDALYFGDSGYGGGMSMFGGRKRATFSNTYGIPSLLDDLEGESARGGRDRSPVGRGRGGGGGFQRHADDKRPTIGVATGHLIHMRGLPFRTTANDIVNFFSPTKILNILILFDEGSGRPMGQADVEFLTHSDAVEAMKKDKEHIGERYIDLFLNSEGPPEPPPPQPMKFDQSAKYEQAASYGGQQDTGLGYAAAEGDYSQMAMGAMADPSMVQYPGYDPSYYGAYAAPYPLAGGYY